MVYTVEVMATVQERTPPTFDQNPVELIERQYELASLYGGEYVVLCGVEVIHHSPSRERAFAAYDRILAESSPMPPVIVTPHRGREFFPVTRGRSSTTSLPPA